MNELDIFSAALDLTDPVERGRFLDDACRESPEWRKRIDALLRNAARASQFLESAAPGFGATLDQPMTEKPGTVIGPYKLLQQIGEGGMGVVYMAEQTEPVERRVALKIIKPGMDTRQVIARFEAERHALAMMDHPNIARVLDAGTTETGRPYFVMELVKGVPITQYCDEHHLTPQERLELFVPVCHAVQHAHQKGIIHRDIKPTNVLVAEYDDRPVPKIIDFGVAKAIDQRLAERTAFTQFGQVVGTIDYMSPEQAKLNQLDIDTRSDIYSLGVLLYELLSGETPFERQRLRSAAFDEILRIIREEEPPRPSLRLSSSGSLPSIAANRDTEPKKLSALVRGELDWIVMKALEKDRTRRYETANGFAADIDRYLSDEPVLACPPSAGYRLRKFARRNKGPVLAVSLVLLALVAGIVGTTLGLLEARTAAEAERKAREAEAQQRQKAEASEKKASEEAAVANAITEFLQQDLLGLAGAEAQLAAKMEPDPNLKLATLLDRAMAKVDERFADQPRVRAEVQATLASAFYSIGRYAEAARLWEQVRQYRETTLGRDVPATLASMHNLALSYLAGFRHADALKLCEETLALRKAKLGPNHPDTLKSMNNLAMCYLEVGRRGDPALKLSALKLCEETLPLLKAKFGPDHPNTLASMNNLACNYAAVGRHADALKLHQEVLALRKDKLGPDHPYTLRSMHNVAICYDNLRRETDALKLYQEVLALSKDKLGPDHPDTLGITLSVAFCLVDLDRSAEAMAILDECLRRAAGTSLDPGMIHSMVAFRLEYFKNAKDAAGCRATAELWEELKRCDAGSLYNAACMRAITAAVIRATDKSEPAAREAAAEADRAIAWLKQAVAAGYKNAGHMKKDVDLNALRDREDFQKLLADLQAGNEKDKK